MSDDRDNDGGEDEPSPLDNFVQLKKPSGSQNRARAEASPLAAGRGPLADFDAEISEHLRALGPPPRGDPAKLTVWQQELSGIIAWAWACGDVTPETAARLKGMAEAVRTGGMVAVKAIDRGLLADIARRLGMNGKPDDGLDPLPTDAATGGANHRRRKPAG